MRIVEKEITDKNIAEELSKSVSVLGNKVVLCTDREIYSQIKFHHKTMGVKRIYCVTTGLNGTTMIDYNGVSEVYAETDNDCIERLLKSCDIVIMRRTISEYRGFITKVLWYKKDFIVVSGTTEKVNIITNLEVA